MTIRCNCESEDCPGDHKVARCQTQVPERTNTVDMIGECCDTCYPHYRDAGYAVDPATGRPLPKGT